MTSSITVLRLHQDERHGCFGPICFEEGREAAAAMAEKGVGQQLLFEVLKREVKEEVQVLSGTGLLWQVRTS